MELDVCQACSMFSMPVRLGRETVGSLWQSHHNQAEATSECILALPTPEFSSVNGNVLSQRSLLKVHREHLWRIASSGNQAVWGAPLF